MSRLKSLAIKLGLALLAGILALAILEGIVRLAGMGQAPSLFGNYAFDEALGWDTIPNFRFVRQGETPHVNYYNPEGFPVEEHNFKNPLSREKPTVVFIGDSFTEGYYLPYRLTFTSLVDQKLPDQQVMNMGVASFSPDQYLLKARRHLGNYNVIQIIVMFFPGNDIADVGRDSLGGYAKPIFGESLEAPTNLPLPKLAGGSSGDVARKIYRRSALVRALTPTVYKVAPWLVDFVAGSGVTPRSYDEAGMIKALRFIKQIEIEYPRAEFVTYYVPHLKEVLLPTLFAHNTQIYRKSCADLEIRCLTLDSVVQRVSDPRELFIERDGHFTELGARLVAEQIYKDLWDS